MVKPNKSNITEQTFTIKNGVKVTALISDDFKGLSFTGRKVSGKQNSNDDPYNVGGKDFRSLDWDDLFDENKINKLFEKYNPMPDESGFNPFILSADNPAGNIGMYLSMTDTVTNRTFGDFIFKDSIGTLLVMLFVLTKCTELADKRGHEYTVGIPVAIEPLYENFCERVQTDTTEKMRMYFVFIGGLIESTCKSVASSPERVFKIISRLIK